MSARDAEVRAEVLREAADEVENLLAEYEASDRMTAHEFGQQLVKLYGRWRTEAEEKAIASAATATPRPELPRRQRRLLAHMRSGLNDLWSTSPVKRLYGGWGVRAPKREAQRDLGALHRRGFLNTAGSENGRRYRVAVKGAASRPSCPVCGNPFDACPCTAAPASLTTNNPKGKRS